MDNELLVKSIRTLCKESNISISQLENELNFGAGLISRWIKSSPSIDKVVDIADYFHVSLDEVVGYKQRLNDDFINHLYTQTDKLQIVWELVTKATNKYPKIKLYNPEQDEYPPQPCNEEEYGQNHYVTKYNNGYIIVYAYYKHESILKPKVVKLFIQPTPESYLIEQEYPQNTLLKLWIKLLKSLGNNAPDEVKAEDFKNDFVLNKIKLNSNNTTSKKVNLTDVEKILTNPDIIKLMEMYNQPAFQELQKTFANVEFQNAIKVANQLQKYFNKGN